MNSRITIQNELKELNIQLPSEKGAEVYSVPEGYFEGFAASVLNKIKAENASSIDELASVAPFLAQIPKKMPFAVPEGYFGQATEGLSEWVKEEEDLPQWLQSARQMPYTVPAGYFENFPDSVLRKVVKTEAKVIPISSSRKWMRYAVAAVITGIIAVSSILYFGNNRSVDPAAQPHEWVAKKLKNVPDKELEEFINSADANTTAIAKTETADNVEVRKLIKDIPDSELGSV